LSEPSQKGRIIRRYVHLLRVLNGRLHSLEAVVQLVGQVELLVLDEPPDLVVGGRLVQGEHIPSDGERFVSASVHSRFVLLINYIFCYSKYTHTNTMSDTAHTEAPEELPEVVEEPEGPVSITKPKKVKKERTPAQKEAFAKAQAKRQETMKAKKLAQAQALLDAEKPAEPDAPEPEPVAEEKTAPAPKKKRAPRKKKEDGPTMTLTPVAEKTAPVPEATDIPAIPSEEPASVPTPAPAPEKKKPAPQKQETLVSVKKREKKSKPTPKEIVYEDSDSESDDEELLAHVYQQYKTALKNKKAQNTEHTGALPVVMRNLKFV
jgi:hypothetical protein